MTDETLVIETPEHVELQFALATIGNRFLACAVDHIIQVVSSVIIYFIARYLSPGLRSAEGSIFNAEREIGLWIVAGRRVNGGSNFA
jgi:hypothetical protein